MDIDLKLRSPKRETTKWKAKVTVCTKKPTKKIKVQLFQTNQSTIKYSFILLKQKEDDSYSVDDMDDIMADLTDGSISNETREDDCAEKADMDEVEQEY